MNSTIAPQAPGFEFSHLTEQSYDAARRIVPLLAEILGQPRSVVDLGGGAGGWLRAFRERGAERILLIDHPSIRAEDLLIPAECFLPCNLSTETPQAVSCDLAMTIECLEHLPESRAEPMVDFLVNSSDFVLFSAAIPLQGGHKHINEQPPYYWMEKFAAHGYVPLDAVRKQIIFDKDIPWWLRQNLRLYVKESALAGIAEEKCAPFLPDDMEVVSQQVLMTKPPELTLRQLLGRIPKAVRNAIRYRIGG